jgi:hypothetical protein
VRFFSGLEPNSSTLVVYDAGNWVWDDIFAEFLNECSRDKTLTNG